LAQWVILFYSNKSSLNADVVLKAPHMDSCAMTMPGFGGYTGKFTSLADLEANKAAFLRLC
jgi:hypothetical protein